MRKGASAAAGAQAQATHLVVFQHGLWGNEKDFKNLHLLFQQYFPQDEIYAHIATSNATSLSSLFQTYDGIDVGGTRLADEIEAVAKEMPRLAKFSIMGHSLGGLYSRYCIGVLFSRGFFENVEPMNFVTLATPHMGIRRSQPTPANAMFNALMPNFFDLTGQQFTLKDTATKQTLELTRSVRRYPHRRPNVMFSDIDDMLLVQLPHEPSPSSHPAKKTLAEAKSFELLECILREGILHLYKKKEAVAQPSENDETSDKSNADHSANGAATESKDDENHGANESSGDATQREPSVAGETDGEDDATSSDSAEAESKTATRRLSSAVEVVRVGEIDLLEAEVTIVLPEKGGHKRKHNKRRPSETSDEPSFWDIEILVPQSLLSVEKAAASGSTTPPAIKYTIRIPYEELSTKWKWIVGISNASHGVHCRLQTALTTIADASASSVAPCILSCLTRGQFIQALQLFRTRTLYSSIFNDIQVPYSCGAIRSFNPYRSERDVLDASRSPYYPHIVMRSIWNAPLLRDTLPEDVKQRVERESSVERFSLVKMISERSRTNSTMMSSASSRDQSFTEFFANLTSTNSSLRIQTQNSSTTAASSTTSSTTIFQQRLDGFPRATSHSNTPDDADDKSDTTRSTRTLSSSASSVKEPKRTPPFEESSLLLDHVDQAFSNDELRDSLRGMMVSLQSVGWRRIDVHFHSPLAHMKIIAMTANPNKPLTKGLDVLHHVMDTFLL